MNGWKRIFVVLFVIAALPALIIAVSTWPWSSSLSTDCATPSRATAEEAAAVLIAGGAVPHRYDSAAADCRTGLTAIASGAKLAEAKSQWRTAFLIGAAIFLGLFAALYAFGWGVAWIRRGFAKPKSAA